MENDKLIFDLHGYAKIKKSQDCLEEEKQMERQVKLIIFKRCENGARMDN